MRAIGLAIALVLCIAAVITGSASASASSSAAGAEFGHARLADFQMSREYTNLNHGSYGVVPKRVSERQSEWRLRVEQNPDRFFRYDVFTEMDVPRKRLAEYLGGVDPDDLAFVINASHGVNAVLRSILTYAPGDTDRTVLYLSTAYQMVKNTLDYVQTLVQDPPLSFVQVNVSYSDGPNHDTFDPQVLIDSVTQTLDNLPPGSVRLACFSHVTSIPSFILPIKTLVEVCHARGVQVMIDGAHAMGQIPVSIPDLGPPDYYISNGHKWMYTPKGTAVLWVAKDQQHRVMPPCVSDEGVGSTPFQKQFSYEGTWDYSGFLSFDAALEYRRALGDENIKHYMHNLAVSGGEKLATMWGTDLLLTDTSLIGAMVNVRLPTTNTTIVSNLATWLLDKYNTWVPAYLLPDGTGRCYMRVSAQIYNELSDFEFLGNAVLALIANPPPPSPLAGSEEVVRARARSRSAMEDPMAIGDDRFDQLY